MSPMKTILTLRQPIGATCSVRRIFSFLNGSWNHFEMSLFNYKFINDTTKLQTVLFISKRFTSKKTFEKLIPTNRALNHFDDFYKAVFGERWPSVRLALLSKPKYMAVINNFAETEKAQELLQNQGAIDLRQFLEVQKKFTHSRRREKSNNKNSCLDEVISRQLQEEEEKESQLHPDGKTLKVKVDEERQKNDENETEEYVYKPEDARTSLDFDMSRAQIDKTRLIMPNSGLLEANLREYIPATILRGAEEFIPESEYYKYYQPKIEMSVSIEKEYELDFPDNLKVYSFDRGDISDFPDPYRNILGTYDYLQVDGSELLAALVLGVQPNDAVLDICSTSGNIAYCILQTLRPKFLVCANDSRGKTKDLFSDYLLDFSESGSDVLFVTQKRVENFESNYLFDKVLVNAPSTEDRTALFDNEDNVFHVESVRNRITLPERQCELLTQGLQLVRPGGTVLYTSATLSPVQNDGVVSQALRTMWEENRETFIVKNLSPALRHTSVFFKYGNYLNLKYGTLVVPFLPSNFGPRYMCKILKKEGKSGADT